MLTAISLVITIARTLRDIGADELLMLPIKKII
jgi:hypothetical protein